MPEKNYVTAERLAELKKELERLKKVTRHEIIAKITEAKAMGDLSENAAYADAKEQQAFAEGKILELEDFLKTAVVIEKKSGDLVRIGSAIKVERGGKTKEFQIVGSNEANPVKGLISNESPLGRAFLGHKPGDNVTVETPAGKAVYKILEIK